MLAKISESQISSVLLDTVTTSRKRLNSGEKKILLKSTIVQGLQFGRSRKS